MCRSLDATLGVNRASTRKVMEERYEKLSPEDKAEYDAAMDKYFAKKQGELASSLQDGPQLEGYWAPSSADRRTRRRTRTTSPGLSRHMSRRSLVSAKTGGRALRPLVKRWTTHILRGSSGTPSRHPDGYVGARFGHLG